jgi:hypothetical protein
MNYIGYKEFANKFETKITDCSEIAVGDYIINRLCECCMRVNICYYRVESRTKKTITVRQRNEFIKLRWNNEKKKWGKNCKAYIRADQLPEDVEIWEG